MATNTFEQDKQANPSGTGTFNTMAAPTVSTANTGLLTPTAAITASAPKDYSADLEGLYQTTLGRAADKGGMDFYADKLRSGAVTLEDVRRDLAGSLEAQRNRVVAPTPTSAPVPKAEAVGYTPTMQQTTPESLVQNQIAAITSTGSQLNELAESRARREASRRGLLNSSMAVEAGQKAVLESALPIAQQDASTFTGANVANAQFSNAAAQFEAAAKNTASLANQQAALQQRLAEIQASTSLSVADKNAASQRVLAEMDANTKTSMQQLDIQNKLVMQNLDDASKTRLSQLEADNRQLLQTNISAANSYAQYVQALAQISTSDKMDAAAKQQAADNQLAALQANLSAIGAVSGLDLSKYYQTAVNMSNQGGSAATPTEKEVEETSNRLGISKDNAKEYLLSGGTRGIGGAANVAGNIAAPGLGKILGKIF